ncbi:MAG: hypothetical protein ABSB42_10630 [Tepidisphaeraceae bacterium]|jgi:hypothetical protein
MDLSKLPKLSKTAQSQPGSEQTESPRPAPDHDVKILPAVGFAEAWISIGLGVLLLFIFPNTIRYLHSAGDTAWSNYAIDAQGNAIPYTKSAYFWTDLGVTVFAIALIVEGIVLAAARKIAPLMFAFCLTSLAAAFNVVVIAHAYPLIGFPAVCGIGVVVLGYMAMTQWRLIGMLRQ